MKQKLKRYAKVCLTVFFMLTIVLQSFAGAGFGVKASDTGYKEMQFGDWGVEAGEVDGVKVYSLTNPSAITDLDGVAISSTVNLNGLIWGDSFITVGGTDVAKHGGFQMISTGGEWGMRVSGIATETDWTWFSNTSDKLNVNVALRMTFDKVDNTSDWTVNVFANGTLVGTATYSGVAPGLYIGFASKVTVDMTPSATTYKELSFADWSTAAGTSGELDVFALAGNDTVTSLEGIVITGKANFNGDAANYFRIGGTEDVQHAGFSLMTIDGKLIIWAQGISTSGAPEQSYELLDAVTWAELIDTEIVLRMVFSKASDTNDWEIEIQINDDAIGTYEFNSVIPGLYIASQGVALSGNYIEMKFGDWETYEGTPVGWEIYSLPSTQGITSLDGIAVSGKVNFNGDVANNLRIGGVPDIEHGGFTLQTYGGQLHIVSEAIGTRTDHTVVQAAEWATVLNTEFTLRLAFTKAHNSNDWKIEIFVNGASRGTYDFPNVTPGMYLASQGVTLPPKYTELKITDWGVDAGESGGFQVYSLTNSEGIDSLNNIAVSGKLNFKGNNEAWFRIGGTKDVKHGGFSLQTYENKLVLSPEGIGDNGTPQEVLTADEWPTLIDTEISLRMEFSKSVGTGYWIVNVYINDKEKVVCDCGPVEPGLYISNSGTAITGIYASTYVSMTDIPKGYYIEETDALIDCIAVYEGNYYKKLGDHVMEYTQDGQEAVRNLVLYIKGDTNVDNEISVKDLVRMKHYEQATGTATSSLSGRKAADLDGDYAVSTVDAEAMRQMLLTYQKPEAEKTLHYGLGEPANDTGMGEVDYASGEFIASVLGAYGVDTYRLWMPCIGTAIPDGDGGYTVTLDQAQLTKLKSLVAKLQLNGVEQIVAMQNPLIPYDFPKYVGKDGKSYTQQQMDTGAFSNDNAVRMDLYAFPEPGTDDYDKFMKVQEEYFRLLSEAVPGITHYEGINEPDSKMPHTIHKIGWLLDSEKQNLNNPSAYDGQSAYAYTIEEIAQITVDHCHAITDGIKAAKSEAKVLSAGLTLLSASYDYLVAAYDYIGSSDNYYKDQTPDNYFEILNWHPYVFFNRTGGDNSELAKGVSVSNWGKDYWGAKWVAYQKKMYSVAESNGDGDTPVWFTEMGQSDYGSYDAANSTHSAGGDITSTLAAQRLGDMFSLVESDLPFVDSVIAFRIFDKGDSTTDATIAGEGGYGMIEEFDKVASGTEALKDYGKKYYNIVKGENASYDALTRVLDEYYNKYKGTHTYDQSDDFECGVVRDNTWVTNHSDMTVTFSGSADYMMQPTMSLIKQGEGRALALDYQATTSTIADPLTHISFNLGRLEAGTYTLSFEMDGESLDNVGYWGTTYYGVTTSKTPHEWTSGAIANDKEEKGQKGVVVYKWQNGNPDTTKNTITFTVAEAKENVSLVFQVSGNVANGVSKGAFRVTFDNIALTKSN